MFDVEPGYWLMVLAIAVCFLTGVVVLASSVIREDDEFSAPRIHGAATDDPGAPVA